MQKIIVLALVISLSVGCSSNPLRNNINQPSFSEGLAAIERKDFATASYHFAELAKEGNPAAMNNLGALLLKVNRKDEAIYWLKSASQYGDMNAKSTLKAMGEDIPPSSPIDRHSNQFQLIGPSPQIIYLIILGISVGISTYNLVK